MNLDKHSRITRLVGGLLVLGLFLLPAVLPSARANPGDLFVAPTGSGATCSQAQPCTLATAWSQAVSGDFLYLAQGTYHGTGTEVLNVTKSVGVFGGWDGAASGPVVRDPIQYPSTLDGEGARRVVSISGNITPTLDGLTITRGDSTGLIDNCSGLGGNPDGCGGGIFVYMAHPIISNNIITDNVAALTTAGYPTGTTGYGGGIYMYNTTRALIVGNQIANNVASVAAGGNGGGISLYNTDNSNRVEANHVFGNYATSTTLSQAWGGGIAGGMDDSLFLNNVIEDNWGNSQGDGMGAGIFHWYGSPIYLGNVVQRNQGDSAVYLGHNQAVFEKNRVVDNDGITGIELLCNDGARLYLLNNFIVHSGSASSVAAYGNVSSPLRATLLNNTIVGSGAGYGVGAGSAYVDLELTNNIVTGYTWGITNTTPASSTVIVDHALFWLNTYDGIRGGGPVDGDPRLVDPATGNCHLGPGSAAIDAGIFVEVTTDIDGDARPIGPAYDIGADEARIRTVFLPLVVKRGQ